MSNQYIAIGDIIGLNQLLANNNIIGKVHMHDTCGAQSFSLSCQEGSEKAVELIQTFFEEKGIKIQFLPGNTDFILC